LKKKKTEKKKEKLFSITENTPLFVESIIFLNKNMNFKNIGKMKTHHSLFTIFCFDFLNTPFFTSLKYL